MPRHVCATSLGVTYAICATLLGRIFSSLLRKSASAGPEQGANSGGGTETAKVPRRLVRDPVCGMTLRSAEIAFQENYKSKTYSFCSDSCRKKFLADPGKYTAQKANVAGIPKDEASERHD